MTFDEALAIISHNETNRAICRTLDEDTQDFVCQLLEKLNAEDFKELSPSGEKQENDKKFDLTDIPIPLSMLKQNPSGKELRFSFAVENTFKMLLKEINTEGTNIEKPFLLECSKDDGIFDAMGNVSPQDITLSEEEKHQECQYDWDKILSHVQTCKDGDSIAILHTHPAPLGIKHKTLYNKYPQILSEMGVQPNGLNLSLADIHVLMYLEEKAREMGKNIDFSSVVLMHDGTLATFSLKNGTTLESIRKIELENDTEFENEEESFFE